MTCKYCSSRLAPLRSLTDGEFCSDEHRQAFREEHPGQGPEERLPTAFETGPSSPPSAAPNPQAKNIVFSPQTAQADPSAPSTPVFEGLNVEPALEEETPDAASAPTASKIRPVGSRHWIARAWKTAPSDLRTLAVLLPILVAVAYATTLPGVHDSSAAKAFRSRASQMAAEEWRLLAQQISRRAAIEITDDFRSGLDSWESRSNLTNTWSFDSNGFVEPGPLAILKPTQELRNYSFEFLGEIQQKAIGCAFRARDLDNYYAVKFIEVNSNSLPTMRLVRYAVINGKEGPHTEKPLPSSIRADMMNRLRVEVRGSDFTILAQGELVDFFSDERLASGGVGFFCNRGEKARLRWVQVSNQYDALGRLCALLAPVNLSGVSKD